MCRGNSTAPLPLQQFKIHYKMWIFVHLSVPHIINNLMFYFKNKKCTFWLSLGNKCIISYHISGPYDLFKLLNSGHISHNLWTLFMSFVILNLPKKNHLDFYLHAINLIFKIIWRNGLAIKCNRWKCVRTNGIDNTLLSLLTSKLLRLIWQLRVVIPYVHSNKNSLISL